MSNTNSKKTIFPAFGYAGIKAFYHPNIPVTIKPNNRPKPPEAPLDKRYGDFYGALYLHVLNYFNIGYADDVESGSYGVKFSVNDRKFCVHFIPQKTEKDSLENLLGRLEEFFHDLAKVATDNSIERVYTLRIPHNDNGHVEYKLITDYPPDLIKLFKIAAKTQKAKTLDCFSAELQRTRKMPLPEQVSAFRSMVGIEDEHITSPTCSGIEFFPPVICPDRDFAYVAFNRSAWKERLVPDSMERIETLFRFAQGRTVEGRGIHLTH